MLDQIKFKDKDKIAQDASERSLSDTNVNEIKTVVNNTVDFINENQDNLKDLSQKIKQLNQKI